MDDKSLIKLVKENPILYNRNSTTSKIKEEKDKAWTQIATKLNKTREYFFQITVSANKLV